MRIVDLSMRLYPGMPVFPGDPQMEAQRAVRWEECGYNVLALALGTHTGTHVDVPLHNREHGQDTEGMPLDRFCGHAVALDAVPDSDNLIGLSPDELERIPKGSAVLLCTGWQERAGTPTFFEGFPALRPGLAEALTAREVRLVGTDLPSVDNPMTEGRAHRALLDAGIPIVEGSVHMDELPRGVPFFFSAVPLAIRGGDGSPVRAYAMVDE